MLLSVSNFARRTALTGVCLLIAVTFTGCQGAQTTPTARPTAATSNAQAQGQLFGGQLPAGLPLDPAAGFGSVEIIQGTTITLTAGRAGFLAGQAPGGQATDGQVPRTRGQDGQAPQGQQGQGGQFQGGQGQRSQGQGGQGLGAFASGSASVVSLAPETKYFKGVSAAPSGTPGPQPASPPDPRPRGTPQPGNGSQGVAPQDPGATPQNGGGRGDRQFAMTVEPATVADVQAGSLIMVWGSVIDGRIYADVVYILPTGPGR